MIKIKFIYLPLILLLFSGCESEVEKQERLQKKILSTYVCKVQRAIKQGANVNYKDLENKTVLIKMCRKNAAGEYDEVINYLLNNTDIDINAQDDSGQTALMYAIELSPISLIKNLINHGSDLNIKDNDNNTALFMIPSRFRDDLVELCNLMLNKGANVNYINKKHKTMLDVIIQASSLDTRLKPLVSLLRKHGAKTAKELQAEENTSPPTPRR